jgi:hypothetical protein
MKLLFRHTVSMMVIASAMLQVAVAQDNVTIDGDACAICPEGEVMNQGDTVLRENTAGFTEANQTCQDIEDLASSGSYSSFQCSLLNASSVVDTCGCGEPEEAEDGSDDASTSGTTKALGKSVILASALAAMFAVLLN